MTKQQMVSGAFAFVFLVGAGYIVATGSSASDASAQDSSTTITSTNGQYTADDIKQHNGSDSCYTAINGQVYDLTAWVNKHPGGVLAILALCGKDGSTAYNAVHGGQEAPAGALERYRIGSLILSSL